MAWSTAILYLFGILNIVLGIVGFVRAKSVASLIGGGVAGILVLVAAFLSKQHPRIGYGLAILVSIALIGRFATKLTGNGPVYAARITVAASVVAVAASIAAFAGLG
jgi:uncharacterized membrane protein (UPF0136 family)